METTNEPNARDFLVYLLKKGILDKSVVAECRAKKQEAADKGYDITIKDILLDQGFLNGQKEYQRLWNDMLEEHRIHQKIENNSPEIMSCYSMSESLLQDMIDMDHSIKSQHPDVPTEVINTVRLRWNRKEESPNNNKILRNPQNTVMQPQYSSTKKSSYVTSYILYCFNVIIFIFPIVFALYRFGFLIEIPHQVQVIEIEIPDPHNHKILDGKTIYCSSQEIKNKALDK
ncbi:MAG TPA: hypothetical protein P5543_04725 [Planctomycetota bacterium]|nr:hypothetical protein [Planctomycetota bacterium]